MCITVYVVDDKYQITVTIPKFDRAELRAVTSFQTPTEIHV